jgi:anaerobic selenocysteine-containing dehydrogenase
MSIAGDSDDPLSTGYLCGKARRLAVEHLDPTRIAGPKWRVSHERGDDWESALDEVAEQISAIQNEHGRDAVGICFGNPVAFNYSSVFFGRLLLMTLCTANRYSISSLDGLPHLVSAFESFGSQLRLPVPDVDRTDFFLIIGANPIVSNGSLMTAPGIRRRLANLRKRGGRIVVVDPRRSETARVADEHLFIRPATDSSLLLAMLHVILRENLDQAPTKWLSYKQRERLVELVAPWNERLGSRVTGICEDRIASLARSFAASRRAVCYGRVGVAHQPFATLTCWLITTLNLVTGNLDRIGGAMFASPAVDLRLMAALSGDSGGFGSETRIGRLPSFAGERPLAALADEITAPGPGRIRALILVGANLTVSGPDGPGLAQALSQLDLLVAIDPYVNETTRLAHVILPPARLLTSDQYPLITSLVAVRNVAKYGSSTLPLKKDERSEWQILSGLQLRLAARRRGLGRIAHTALASAAAKLGPARLLSAALLAGPYGVRRLPRRPLTLALIRRRAEGVDLGPLRPMLRHRWSVRALPAAIVDELKRYELSITTGSTVAPTELLLISRRQRGRINSMVLDPHSRGPSGALELLIHPDDAAQRAITDGCSVSISSSHGSIVAVASLTTDLMPGVVSLPHGHGRPGVASSHINVLIPSKCIDRFSGTTAFSGIPVTVAAMGKVD